MRYAYATLCVLIALVAAIALHSFDLEGFVFVIAVAVAVWLGGRGPGVLAVVLSVLALHFVFIAPIYTGAMPHTVGYFVVFSVLALLITTLTEGRHRAERSLLAARHELETRVEQRTEDLQRKQDLLDLAQKSARAMAFDWYFQKEINVWSPEQEALYGLAPGAFDGRYLTWKNLVHPADWPLVVAAMTRARQNGEIAAEFRVIWPDGTVHWLAANGRLFLDERGEPHRMVGFTADVTARKLAEEAQAKLAHVSRLTTLGEVTASLAHELNQPLAAILNNGAACLALLQNGRADRGEVQAALGDIVADAERARAIMERVRRLARRSLPEKLPLALGDIVADVVALAAPESAARRVAIRSDIAGNVPIVMGDRVQLQQVLLNLIVNGMDAMSAVPEGTRLLEIRIQRDGDDAVPSARVAVRDRGVGLDPDELDRVFEAFYTTKPQGMGMGLAISRSIIEAHGGRLWVEATTPGATFSFRLPAASA